MQAGSSSNPTGASASAPVRRRLTSKQPPPATNIGMQLSAPDVRINKHSDIYYTHAIELYWSGRGPSVAEVLSMEWFEAQPRWHKHIMDLVESGLPFQIKLKMVWLIDIPSRGIYDQLNGINMVPFRVTPGVAARLVPSYALDVKHHPPEHSR